MIPCRHQKSKTSVRNKGGTRGKCEFRCGTSFILFHCMVLRSSPVSGSRRSPRKKDVHHTTTAETHPSFPFRRLRLVVYALLSGPMVSSIYRFPLFSQGNGIDHLPGYLRVGRQTPKRMGCSKFFLPAGFLPWTHGTSMVFIHSVLSAPSRLEAADKSVSRHRVPRKLHSPSQPQQPSH